MEEASRMRTEQFIPPQNCGDHCGLRRRIARSQRETRRKMIFFLFILLVSLSLVEAANNDDANNAAGDDAAANKADDYYAGDDDDQQADDAYKQERDGTLNGFQWYASEEFGGVNVMPLSCIN